MFDHRLQRKRRLPAIVNLGVLCAAYATSITAANNYLVHNLVSDLPNMAADHVDPNLVNPWGIGIGPNSPFWIGDNHSGMSTLYDTGGTPRPLSVRVPQPGRPDMPGATTGVLFNSTQSFLIGGQPSTFIFCTEDGTIAGWNSSVDPTHAVIMIDNSSSRAVYKGCALGISNGPTLYAANFNSGQIDVFDGSLNPVKMPNAFADPMIPSGFAPFNIAVLQNRIYVTFAKQDAQKMDDVAGPGNGYVDVFDMNGVLLSSFLSQGALNSPWGMAIAPPPFGDFAGMLLVGNFGDGRINVYNPNTGMLAGQLADLSGKAIQIRGLWSLQFGNGGPGGDPNTLYFTAGIPGPDGDPVESHGLFGSIEAFPLFDTTNVVNSASGLPPMAPNTWVSIYGGALSAATRNWQSGDFVNGNLPVSLAGVSATINGEPAYLSYVSPTLVNLLIPADIPAGPAKILFTNNGLVSPPVTVALQAQAPAIFNFGGGRYVAATHGDNSPVSPPNSMPGVVSTPAKPGETIVLWGTGFGPTASGIPNGRVITTPMPLAGSLPVVTVAGENASVIFAGLSGPGLYQLNVVVPIDLPPGDAAVVVIVNGTTAPVGMISIGQAQSAVITQ
jgi:uncharacterized protein (TIGR03118 family)